MEKQEVALQARMMSKLMRKITAICNRTETTVIFINQLRTNVGQLYGDNSTPTGGKALSFFATQRINLRKVKLQKEDGLTEEEGMKVNVKIVKNRCAYDNPYKTTSYTVVFGKGIDVARELASLAVQAGVATSGTWIYIPTKENPEVWNGHELKFQGKAKFIEFIRNHPEFQDELRKRIRETIKLDSLTKEEIEAIEQAEEEINQEFAEIE